MPRPTLYLFAGLPGTGKTTLARALAQHLGACHLRIDTIEQGLRELCHLDVQGEGYRLACRIAADNLRLGQSVVADMCNPIELTRDEWETVARDLSLPWRHIEVVCTDRVEHRRRIDTRTNDIAGLHLPDWAAVQQREYHAWTRARIVIDTAHTSPEAALADLLAQLAAPP